MTAGMSDSLTELTPALIKAKQAFKPAVKDSTNPHFRAKFLSLAGVYDSIDEALLANGIVALQPTRLGEDGKTILVTTLLHQSGQWISGEYPVTAAQPGPQGEGSALTYARRYALMAMVGIAPEDDDGQAAQPVSSIPQARPAPARAQAAAKLAPDNVLAKLKADVALLTTEQSAELMRQWREQGFPKLELLSKDQADAVEILRKGVVDDGKLL